MTPRRWWSPGLALAMAVSVAGTACAGRTPRADVRDFGGRAAAARATRAPDARTVVRVASLAVTTRGVDSAAARIAALVRGADGEVERSAADGAERSMTLRIPDARLEAVMDSIGALGRVTSRSLTMQDVTAEVIDLEARLASLVAARDRLRLLQQRAESVADVVAVERELARVQGEIDSMTGRRDHLRDQADRSTLAVTLRPARVLGPLGAAAYGLGWVVEKLFVIR
ncbi:MAG: DUF4349 domain-containing protein [Gemmatimonadaceae bacterium]|nr:DUF4349 domain-containing protein [Gemmatimonadaceae bacterium]